MPSRSSSMLAPEDYLLDGDPISHDFRAAQRPTCLHTNKLRSRRSKDNYRFSSCKTCEAMAIQRYNQSLRRSDRANRQDAVNFGRELAQTPGMIDEDEAEEGTTIAGPIPLARSTEAREDEELWRMGLLYVDERDRGEGLSLDVIRHAEQEFSICYKPLRGASRRRRRRRRQRGEPLSGVASPALSYVKISSDEELAAFLAVYDFVDVGDDDLLEDEMFEVLG